MFKADTDEAEESFKKQLLSKLPVVPAHKILCCERDKSRVAMARHIQPLLHIDSNVDVWMDLKGKIPNSVLLKNDSTSLEHEDESRSLTECASLVKCFTTA